MTDVIPDITKDRQQIMSRNGAECMMLKEHHKKCKQAQMKMLNEKCIEVKKLQNIDVVGINKTDERHS